MLRYPEEVFDYSSTAQRTPWLGLPEQLRSVVEEALGGSAESVTLAGGGFTPGFAGVVRSGDQELFVKAAARTDDWLFASYAREAEVHAEFPVGIPTPKLLDSPLLTVDQVEWQLLVFSAVPGRMPGSPWTGADLASIEKALLATEEAFSAALPTLTFDSLAADFAQSETLLSGYRRPLPSFAPRLSASALNELDQLAGLAPEALRGTCLQHNDLRPDNILIDRGEALFCDWNFLSFGPRWADWVVMLAYARFGGLEVAPWLQDSPLSASADPDHIDSWLAILASYFLDSGAKPEVPNSPQLRAHGQFSAQMILDWLIERRSLR